MKYTLSAITAVLANQLTAVAAPINITVPDNQPYTLGGSWASAVTAADPANEDQEVEPGATTGQVWDLERLLFESSSGLTVLGGFNYKTTVQNFAFGDIFIDVNNSFDPGSAGSPYGYSTIVGSMGYEYAVVFKRKSDRSLELTLGGDIQYQVVGLNNQSNLEAVWYSNFVKSNPYRVEDVPTGSWKIAGYGDFETDSDANSSTLAGGTGWHPVYGAGSSTDSFKHYYLTLDLSPVGTLGNPDLSELNITLGCGNDEIHGRVPGGGDKVPDGGSTLTLLGLGLVGMWGVRRLKS